MDRHHVCMCFCLNHHVNSASFFSRCIQYNLLILWVTLFSADSFVVCITSPFWFHCTWHSDINPIENSTRVGCYSSEQTSQTQHVLHAAPGLVALFALQMLGWQNCFAQLFKPEGVLLTLVKYLRKTLCFIYSLLTINLHDVEGGVCLAMNLIFNIVKQISNEICFPNFGEKLHLQYRITAVKAACNRCEMTNSYMYPVELV